MVKKFTNTVPWIYVVSNLNGEEIVETFYEKKLQKKNQTQFRHEKATKRKGDKCVRYVKWKDYDNSLNNWIKKKLDIFLNQNLSGKCES